MILEGNLQMKLEVYGCRGSVAISRSDSRYGGNSSCITLTKGDDFLVIDAGSGIMMLQDKLQNQRLKNTKFPINILLSHLHLDHIIGLGTFDPIWRKNKGVRIFTSSRDERPLDEQICDVFSPPYWPLPLKDFGKLDVVQIEPETPFEIGIFKITPFETGLHSDKTLSFYITDGKKTLVYLLDSEMVDMDEIADAKLLKYCNGADIVVFDSSYSEKDYTMRKGWGHSTVKAGVELSKKWKCKHMLFTHFDQKYNDDEIDNWQKVACGDKFIFAQDGLVIEI